MQKRYKAAIALGVSLLGAGISYPYAAAGFWEGMLHNGFLAASIGGLADWFAVTALFRKPLGISYRTQILTRNRERIMNAIVDFASQDLLSVENIMQVVEKQDTARMMVDYLRLRDGRQKLLDVLDHVLLSVARQTDARQLVRQLRPLLAELLQQIPMEKVAGHLLVLLDSASTRHAVAAFVQKFGLELLAADSVQHFLLTHIVQLRKSYEAGSAGRAFVLGLIDLSDEKILQLLNDRCRAWLLSLEEPTSPAAAALDDHWRSICEMEAIKQQAAALWKHWTTGLADSDSWEDAFCSWLSGQLHAEQPVWLLTLNQLAEDKLTQFAQSEELQQRYDRLIKKMIAERLQEHHPLLRQLIQQRLDEFSNEELTEFVESRIADDLQMIRINGSLVGAVVGMLLYAVVFCIEKVYTC